MANRTNANPFVIDTASATPITRQKIRIQKLRWDAEAAAAGDNVVVTNTRAGLDVFWAATAAGVDAQIESDFLGTAGDCDGMIVPTLNSGKLYIYYE